MPLLRIHLLAICMTSRRHGFHLTPCHLDAIDSIEVGAIAESSLRHLSDSVPLSSGCHLDGFVILLSLHETSQRHDTIMASRHLYVIPSPGHHIKSLTAYCAPTPSRPIPRLTILRRSSKCVSVSPIVRRGRRATGSRSMVCTGDSMLQFVPPAAYKGKHFI